jgi:hypothetical protein
MAPAAIGGDVWACVVEADVACRVCALRTPVRGVETASEIVCERCHTRQAFSIDQWREALGQAHHVASDCGPRVRAGGDASFAAIGETWTFLEHTQQTTIFDAGGGRALTLRVKVAPGQPLCTRCHVPLGVELDGAGHVRSTCARCAEVAVYAVPPAAAAQYAPFVGVLAAEQRSDRPRARLERAGGEIVAALKCPTCGAGLTPNGHDDIATCAHCNTAAVIPRGALARRDAPPVFTPFWLLFRGPFDRRATLTKDELEMESLMAAHAKSEKTGMYIGAAGGIIGGLLGLIVAIFVLVDSCRHHHH